jgi:hypothetical protein
MQFIYNIFIILSNVPAIIAIVKGVINCFGSAEAKQLLDTIKDALPTEKPNTPVDEMTEPQRQRVLGNFLQRLGRFGDQKIASLDTAGSAQATTC